MQIATNSIVMRNIIINSIRTFLLRSLRMSIYNGLFISGKNSINNAFFQSESCTKMKQMNNHSLNTNSIDYLETHRLIQERTRKSLEKLLNLF